MTTHLSVRLAWHDRGWDGHVCDAPHLNAHCIIHEHIRNSRDDKKEVEFGGVALADLKGWLPPCSRDPAAYSKQGFNIIHSDPLEFRKLPSVAEFIPPHSCCPAPYRWMREEFFREICEKEDLSIRGPDGGREIGWVYEPDRQLVLLDQFWGKIDVHQSLIFYYCNHGNPLDENASRIVVGVGRVKELGEQQYFGTKGDYQDQYPVWSRRVTQAYPDQGVRIPYQEYLREGHSTDEIICRVPQSALLPFSYGGEHVSDDIAVGILELVIQSIERVISDGHIPGNWEQQLAWLNEVLAEAWNKRGPFPGTGSILEYLGCSKGTSFQRTVLAPMSERGENPWEYVLSILDGSMDPEQEVYKSGLADARERWKILKFRQPLLSRLARFELTLDQVRDIANPDQRLARGIDATETALVENPYILCECDLGTKDSNPVALESIDHGVRSEGYAALFSDNDEMAHDDRRRVRAIGVEILQEAANNGDTVLEYSDFLRRVYGRFPESRACQPDREIVLTEAEFYQEILWTDFESDFKLVALEHLKLLESYTAGMIKRRAKRVNADADPPIDWLSALKLKFHDPKTERESLALEEKEKALQTLFSRRLSVLVGGAGTGKTSVLTVFLDELVRSEGHNSMLLLAPTGKARVRLSTETKRNAMTIHQFLLKQGWFQPNIFALKKESNSNPWQATTIVIDECSMIPIDLFGTLLRALDPGPLSRLILVGDPNQLPPIGPGRPFADIIEWLQREYPECVASLNVGMRVDENRDELGTESVALALAEGYRTSTVNPGDDEVLAAIALGKSENDLEVVFWEDHDELLAKLNDRMEANLGIRNGYKSFNASLGINKADLDPSRSEDWQILTPTRAQHFGTDDLNRLIQKEYKGGLIAQSKNPYSTYPKPFGEQEIVWSDKVIQVVNQSKKGWPRDVGLDYVANGEIGIVRYTRKSKSDYGDVVFSTQSSVSYRYFRQQMSEELELAYALTVHKAQGSDFKVVFFIVPQNATTLSRELIYTGLTRFREKLVLLIEKDIGPLLRLRNPECSNTRMRNTNMFTLTLRPNDIQRPHLEALIHRTRKGVPVRSKSEVIVADILENLGISYRYEQPLFSRSDSRDFRLPDFTVSFEGDTYYWEHLGMLGVPNYREAWNRKLAWYKDNRYVDRLITSKDAPDGSIDASIIERIAREQILDE